MMQTATGPVAAFAGPAAPGPDPGADLAARRLRETCHDMQQPVACVLALAAAALSEEKLPPAARSRLEQIVEQARWLGDMLRPWLRPAGAPVPFPDPADEVGDVGEDRPGPDAAEGTGVDVAQVAGAVAAAESLTWGGSMEVVLPSGAVNAAAHPVALRRAVANLVGNATRAAGPSGSVRIVVRRDSGATMVSVEDSGPGFGRIEKGLGLGLPAVARYVARCGGWLDCGSGGLGGARVRLWLPAASRDAPARDAAGSA